MLFGLLKTLIVTVFAVAAAATGLSAHSLAAERDKTANLTGAWRLNKDLSDDPAQAMAGMQGERRGGSGHGPWRHGGGGRGGMDPGRMETMHRAMEAAARLTITQADGSITFTDGDGRSQRLTTNNKKEELPLDDRTVEVRTKWDDGRLVKETSLGDGMKLTETYSLVSEPRRLHVMVKLDSSHLPRPVNLRRVYDAAYDTKSEATFKGTVADVKTTGRSALYWLFRIHTLGQGQTGVQEKQLLLKTDTGTVQIQLGPTAFLTEKNVEIRKGDILEVTGSRVTIGESQVVLAREIRNGDDTWALRDATGQPLWSSVQRGFWTKKRVLVAVVVIKGVALATVLRH